MPLIRIATYRSTRPSCAKPLISGQSRVTGDTRPLPKATFRTQPGNESLRAWLQLANLQFSPRLTTALLDHFGGDPQAVFAATDMALEEVPGCQPRHIDVIAQEAGMTAVQAGVEMTLLELSGLVRRLPGNTYIRNALIRNLPSCRCFV